MQDGERRRHSAGEHSHGDDADGTRRVADEEGGHSSVEHQHQQQQQQRVHDGCFVLGISAGPSECEWGPKHAADGCGGGAGEVA